ncbi:MAG: nucleotidyltransferase domain-containing protein [Planctomycetes bacterium]|nr:nucleotidyltransferase domain-containing protein [Planctomycetota bacterium]
MVAMTDIKQVARRIAEEFRPERIILFGSRAQGDSTVDSDVDLLVILPHEGKCWEAAAAIRSRVRPPFPTDLLVRSPQELRERLEIGDVFFREITEHGKVLYEAPHG